MKLTLQILVLVGLVVAAVAPPPSKGSNGKGTSKGKSAAPNHKRPHKPHMVYVLVDEWGDNEIGYNNPFFESPFMDELAATGIKLTHFYAATMCTPSRARLMTGKHETRYGLQSDVIRPDTPYGLPLDLETMPDRMKKQGYSTHLVGKWHLGSHNKDYLPLSRGFDTFWGYLSGIIDYFSHSLICPTNPADVGYDMRDGWDPVPVRQMDGIYDAFLFSRQAQRVIDKQDPKKPMFMYLSSHDVHFAPVLQAPQKYIDHFLPKVAGMPAQQAFIFSRLGAKVKAVDDMVRDVVTALKENGMWDNTILIVTTDNGRFPRGFPAYFTAPLLQPAPSEARDGRQRGPAFIHSPLFPDSAKGSVIDDLTTICDFFPTMLNIAGDHIDPATTDGVDLWDLLVNGAPSTREEYLMMIDHAEELVGEAMYPERNTFDTRQLAAIRIGDYKLVTGCEDFFPTTWSNGTYLQKGCHKFWHDHHRNYYLYNIRQDRYETTDLADDPAQMDRILHMLDRLKYYDDQSVPALERHPEAQKTTAACPSNLAENEGRQYNFFGPWTFGSTFQDNLPTRK